MKEKDQRSKARQVKLLIQNRLGLHARPAALFVQTANQYRSEIEVQKGRTKANGKSIMGIMTLAAGRGSEITIRADGPDADEALTGLTKLVRTNFGE